MSYIAISDVRAEGVTSDMASDALLSARIAELEPLFESFARTWFSAQTRTYSLKSWGKLRLALPQPLIQLTEARSGGSVVTDIVTPNRGDTELVRRYPFPRSTIEVTGTFGNVDSTGACPGDVKGALVTWVLFAIAPKTDVDALNDRRLATATAASVGGRHVQMAPVRAPWSGHPDVDRVIAKYRRSSVAVV